jgi:hypothetical protein
MSAFGRSIGRLLPFVRNERSLGLLDQCPPGTVRLGRGSMSLKERGSKGRALHTSSFFWPLVEMPANLLTCFARLAVRACGARLQ